MIGVGKLDLRADRLEIGGRQCALDGRLRADIHKDRRLDCPMRAAELSPARRAVRFQYFKHRVPLPSINIHRIADMYGSQESE